MIISLIFGLLLGALAVIFVVQNTATVAVTFLAWQLQGSLALVIFLAIATGVLITLLFSLPDLLRKSFIISKLSDHNDELKDQLTSKSIEVESEKSKVAANNAYLDDLEKDRANGDVK